MVDFSPRLRLWRKAFYLFHEARRRDWRGPFKEAGYNEYRVERLVFDAEGDEHNPDIIAAGDRWWAILEITSRPKAKDSQLDGYADIRGESLPSIGLSIPEEGPVLAVLRPTKLPAEESPQIVLGDQLEIENLSGIPHEELVSALESARGAPLDRIPEISVTLVPECKSNEIRTALVPMVLELFSPERPELTSMDMVEAGLERISPLVSANSKKSLQTKIENELEGLLETSPPTLSDYLEQDGRTFRAKAGASAHPNTLNRVRGILGSWLGGPSRLTDFEGAP